MILIVDDDPALAENCAMLLQGYGYDTEVAHSGTEALDKIGFRHLHLLISDCSMPGMDGLELSRKVKAKAAQTPIMLMSGSLQSQVACGNSYEAFMRKPFLAEELLSKVRRLLPHYTH